MTCSPTAAARRISPACYAATRYEFRAGRAECDPAHGRERSISSQLRTAIPALAVGTVSFLQGARQMKLNHRNWLGVSSLLVCLALPFAANADLPGKHPAYLHALSDLRAARWMLEHRPGDAAVSEHEDMAIMEIDKAIGEIKHAAIDDGKDIHDHPPM